MQKIATLVTPSAPKAKVNRIDMADCHLLLQRKDAAHAAAVKAREKAHAEEMRGHRRLIQWQTSAILGLATTIVTLLFKFKMG